MGKITVKHFLNTNLKPYLINGEKYYSIYALVTANRQNTKVKSRAFNEYYTENDFSDIINFKDLEDKQALENEEKAIINIANLVLYVTDSFDTTFFAAIYNYFQTIHISDTDIEMHKIEVNNEVKIISLYAKDKNAMRISIDTYLYSEFSIKENNSKGMSLFTWFSHIGQNNLKEFLKKNSCQIDLNIAIDTLNKIIFYTSLEKLYWIFKGSKKFESLTDKYNLLFENRETYLSELYKTFLV